MKQDEFSIVKHLENAKSQKKQDVQERGLSRYKYAAVADRIRAALCSMQPILKDDRTFGRTSGRVR